MPFTATPWEDLPSTATPITSARLRNTDTQYAQAMADGAAAFAPIGDLAFSTLDAAVAATPAGGTLEVRGAWSKTLPLVINKAMTLRFRGGSITQTTDTPAISVTANNVSIEAPTLTGVGGSTSGTGAAISAIGTVGSPILSLRVSGGTIDGWAKYGVYVEQAQDLAILDVIVKNIAYAGIMILSAIGGSVQRTKVSNIIQPTGLTNSYGIALTRNSNQSIAVAPRTSGFSVSDNIVDGVVNWEGIDTHGGQDLRITHNRVLNTKVAIACVPCPNEGGVDTYAPIGIVVSGNFIDSTVTDGSRLQGIQVVGAGVTLGSPVESASAIVTDNTIHNHGSDSLANGGAIIAYFTKGCVIANNRLVAPAVAGVNLYHSNDSIVVAGNSVLDVWTTATATAAAIYVRSQFNVLTASLNTLSAGTKSATFVNRYGVQYATPTSNKYIDGGGNNFTIATTVLVGLTSLVSQAFFGAAPVLKPTGTPAAATDLATALTLVNDLRTKLMTNLGVIG